MSIKLAALDQIRIHLSRLLNQIDNFEALLNSTLVCIPKDLELEQLNKITRRLTPLNASLKKFQDGLNTTFALTYKECLNLAHCDAANITSDPKPLALQPANNEDETDNN